MTECPAITGLGIVCAIGNDATDVLDSLRKGESGIRKMRYLGSRHDELPVGEVQMSGEQMKKTLGITDGAPMSRTSLMGAMAVRQALNQAGIGNFTGRRVALVSGTTVGRMDITEKYHLPNSNECGRSTMEMARMAGLEDAEICTISTACSSALNAIIVGSELLRHDEADVVIAGGAEALSVFHLNGFNTLMILDRERCRPFDKSRAGLNLGEGAAFVVLEKGAEHPLAYIAGYGNRCDAFHQTASSENGEGAFLAMKEALETARLVPDEIQYVNAHGTGTPNNDLSESIALKRIFGEKMPEVSSTKPFTGHTTSASGSIETVISVLAMLHGFTPANLGWKKQAEGVIVPTMGTSDVRIDNVLCNSFGFGGNDSSLVISRNAPESSPSFVPTFDCVTAAEETVSSVEELEELKEFVPPMESRRMGKLMKAALLSSLRALKDAGLERPDAIIAATSHGMLEVSQHFLSDIISNGEETLSPTLFMQSTHNTLASAIAVRTKCHGYNITYSQGDDSVKWALRDARRLIMDGKVESVLVGQFDESTVPVSLHARSIVLKRK